MNDRDRRLAAVFLLAVPLLGQYDPRAPLTPETILVARIRNVAAENAVRIPDFTCGMTIERSLRRPRSGRFEPDDTLRLEVAYAGGKELYAWPGAKQFEDRDISLLVGTGGAIGTGDFTSHVQSVLLSSGPRFTYIGEEPMNGHACHRFDYTVAREQSSYFMRIPPVEDRVGYRGSFWVDKITMDLVKLIVDADDIPLTLPVRQSLKVIELERQRIGGTEFLLPIRSELEIQMTDGTASLNRTTFLNCHQFRGESSLTFEDPLPDASPAPAIVQTTLPDGLKLNLALTRPVDLKTVATGDQVFFQLAKESRTKDGFAIPKGAEFFARVDRLECVNAAQTMCYLMLHLESFRYANKEGIARAALEAPTFDLPSPPSLIGERRLSRIPFPAELMNRPPDRGVIAVRGGRQTLGPGYSTIWRVLPPK